MSVQPLVAHGPEAFAVERTEPSAPTRLRAVLVTVDALCLAIAWAAALVAGIGSRAPARTALAVATLVAIGLAANRAQQLYRSRMCAVRSVELQRLGRSAAACGAAAVLLPPFALPGATAFAGGVAAFVTTATGRALYRSWVGQRRQAGRDVRPIVVVGANDEAARLCSIVATHPELGLRVRGILGDAYEYAERTFDVPWLGEPQDALDVLAESGSTGVLIAASAVEPGQLNRLARACLARNLHVQVSTGLHGIAHTRLRPQPLAREPLFCLEPLRLRPWQQHVKRALDVALAGLALVVLAPVFAAVALAVKLSDGGSVFFRQQRIGKGCRPFTIFKFRTMDEDAEQRYIDLVDGREGRDGPLIKLRRDPRVTPLGRVLRATSIDELPQLWNVVRGDMSLVGPRPAQASEVARFDEELLQRQRVRPGISGLWQVEARDNPSFEAYRRFDLFYIENWSVSLDLAILMATVQAVLVRAARFAVAQRGRGDGSVEIALD